LKIRFLNWGISWGNFPSRIIRLVISSLPFSSALLLEGGAFRVGNALICSAAACRAASAIPTSFYFIA
jgi:hypothetical protein